MAVDLPGNIVEKVRYHDGGRWTRWADGRGSSLERVDPEQDNSVASAWAASDESPKSTRELVEYLTEYGRQLESESQMRLPGAGKVLVDAVEVRCGATQ